MNFIVFLRRKLRVIVGNRKVMGFEKKEVVICDSRIPYRVNVLAEGGVRWFQIEREWRK